MFFWALSYMCMKEVFLSKISELGYDPRQFDLYSLRGGVPPLLQMVGCPFKRHGRWKTESAKDG